VQWRLLAGVPDEEVRQLVQVARRRTFARNEVVLHRDDPGDSLHLINKGHFSIRVTTPLGHVAMLGLGGPGDSFGEMALVSDDARRAATVTSLDEGETFAVTRGDFERLRGRYPEVNEVLLRLLQNHVRLLHERLLEALYVPVEKRVLRRLVELAAVYRDEENQALISLTQESLAELAGASRATVNQVLRQEERRGLLELHRGQTRILDLATLAKRAAR
jgi:CRP/FNR family cyclic AMP-dependent transcriptional regulator